MEYRSSNCMNQPRGFDNSVPMMPPVGTRNTVPLNPDVRLKVLPFYDVKGELLKPSSLIVLQRNARFQKNLFWFHLTPQEAQDITMSRDFRPCAKSEYLVQIQLRFCLLNTSCEQEDNFPLNVGVRVNGKTAVRPNLFSKPGAEPKSLSGPVDITPLCRLSPTASNHVYVFWEPAFGRDYCVAIYLVKKLSPNILFSRLKQRRVRHPHRSRALIKKKLTHDPNSEIATTSLRVSLSCPLGKMKIQNPCRARTCSHFQCFDANTFLMMNEKKATWTCPVCGKPAPFDQLIIDGLFVEILQQTVDCDEIEFLKDCSWKPLGPTLTEIVVISSPVGKKSSNGASSSSPKKPASVPELIVISDSSDDDSNS